MEAGGVQVGRDSERECVSAVLRSAATGHPGALLVAGEPGIGKTSLVAEVTSGPEGSPHLVLWGRCLRFGADSSPYLPFTQMLTQWHRQAPESERERVLTGAGDLASIAPALGAASGPADTARMVPLLESVLDRIAESTPLALIVDDVQWADGTSLDVLAYLLAGFHAGQRLCLLVTYRDTDLGEGHRLHGWLADVVRLPSVSRIRLERLGYADAEELVARLRGGSPSGPDAADVFARSGGNPYYTELLMQAAVGAGDTAKEGGLQQALLSSWHRLGRDARELLQLLALGGRPVSVGVLERLVAARGGTVEHVPSSLTAATHAGLATVSPDGDAWFHHPLIAEVVSGTLTPIQRRQVHQQYVDVLEAAADLTPASRAAHLALHHNGAGDPDQAFSWSLRAADEAATVRGYAEESDHLHRACRLWGDAGEAARAAAGHPAQLWHRASDSAWSAGEYSLALRLREEAITLAEADDEALTVVRLRLPLHNWRFCCGLEAGSSVAAERSVLELAETHCPSTPEHVQAIARLAHAEMWSDDDRDEARRHAETAVRMARRTASSEALAWALCVRSQTRWGQAGLADSSLALSLAREVGNPELLGWAAVAHANVLFGLGRDADAAEQTVTTFWQLLGVGSVSDALWVPAGHAAAVLLDFGRWQEAQAVLRELLSQRLAPGLGAHARGAAAVLAFRTGDVASGNSHLVRARELRPGAAEPGEILGYCEVEARWSVGQTREALSLVAQMMPAAVAVNPGGADELLVMAARAAADQAEAPGHRDEAVALLDRVEVLRGADPPWFEPATREDLVHPARGSLFAADRARCHADADTTDLWRTAAAACGEAGMVWHEALASYHLARAVLASRGSRAEAAAALRHTARIAADLGAVPVLRNAEDLARQTHILLDEPSCEAPSPRGSEKLPGVTPREREVLSLLVAGRTYAEIAAALFISEKTVSVHVSNLLRKTGTSSRVELADLVRRSG